MKRKNGFVFVETIVTTVVLLCALLYIYGTYSSMIKEERKRLYFDDISYVYKTQIIKEILEDSISHKFAEVVRGEIEKNYISVFNYGSDIYKEESNGPKLIKAARELYDFGQIFYIDKGNISHLKECLRLKKDDNVCQETIKRIEGYGDTNFYNYLEKLDISQEKIELALDENATPSSGIILVIYYKAKNGDKLVNYGTYNECIVENYNKNYGASVNKMSKVKSEYKGYFTMQCENAYYISWAYFNADKIN